MSWPYDPLMRLIFLILVVLCLPIARSIAQPLPLGLIMGESVQVSKVQDDGTLILVDGRHLVPSFLYIPNDPRSLGALRALVQGRHVELTYDEWQSNRHGDLIAHLMVDGTWVQHKMLALGWAQLFPRPGQRLALSTLLVASEQARLTPTGFWASDEFCDFSNGQIVGKLDQYEGSYCQVWGEVTKVAHRKYSTYINFSGQWKTDFTVYMSRGRITPQDLDRLDKQRIRIYGFVRSFNGPLIDLSHPEQLQIWNPETRQWQAFVISE